MRMRTFYILRNWHEIHKLRSSPPLLVGVPISAPIYFASELFDSSLATAVLFSCRHLFPCVQFGLIPFPLLPFLLAINRDLISTIRHSGEAFVL